MAPEILNIAERVRRNHPSLSFMTAEETRGTVSWRLAAEGPSENSASGRSSQPPLDL